jgi:hypothetical protein
MINHAIPNREDKSKANKLGITLPKKTLQQMDEIRGDIPRSKFIYRSLVEYMSKKKTLLAIPICLVLMTAAGAARLAFAKHGDAHYYLHL